MFRNMPLFQSLFIHSRFHIQTQCLSNFSWLKKRCNVSQIIDSISWQWWLSKDISFDCSFLQMTLQLLIDEGSVENGFDLKLHCTALNFSNQNQPTIQLRREGFPSIRNIENLAGLENAFQNNLLLFLLASFLLCPLCAYFKFSNQYMFSIHCFFSNCSNFSVFFSSLELFLLAPTGALIVLMVYYIYIYPQHRLFQIFTQSL